MRGMPRVVDLAEYLDIIRKYVNGLGESVDSKKNKYSSRRKIMGSLLVLLSKQFTYKI